MQITDWLERPSEGGLPRKLRMRIGVGLGLLFLAGPADDLARSSLGAAHRVALAAGLAVFVAVYLSLLPPSAWLFRRGQRALHGALALLGALALGLLLGGAPGSFVALFVYFVAAAGMLLRPAHAAALTASTAIAVGLGTVASGRSASSAATIALTVGSIGALMAAFGRQVRSNRELQAAREELARLAVSEERLRIARDLHDLLGHTLSVIALKSELAGKLVEHDPERARAELDDVQAVTRDALSEVREAVRGYRRLALRDALDGARAALAAAGIDCRLDGAELDLPADVEAVLAWAVREGATNVVRHSDAESCTIRVTSNGRTAAVEVEDDGAGAVPGPLGSGLRGLAERAERVRGRLEAGVGPRGGFRLRLTVPLRAT
jgi:two-component system, NarL family, sensor histidine kinase DesK